MIIDKPYPHEQSAKVQNLQDDIKFTDGKIFLHRISRTKENQKFLSSPDKFSIDWVKCSVMYMYFILQTTGHWLERSSREPF